MIGGMERPEEPAGDPVGRRAFLGLVGFGLSSLVWGQPVLDSLYGSARRLVPSEVLTALPLPSSGWRIYAVNPPHPTFDPATWRLRVDGLVERPLELTFDELRALPRAGQTSDFHCVTGWTVEDVRWGGVRFTDLLAAARPLSTARAIEFVSAEEPYADTLTLDQARSPDAMLAYEMDGAPLTRPHGGPARVVMPRMYGYKGVKWVRRLRLTDAPPIGYWEQRGYDRDAWIGASNGY